VTTMLFGKVEQELSAKMQCNWPSQSKASEESLCA
jgi:hypothetical protein